MQENKKQFSKELFMEIFEHNIQMLTRGMENMARDKSITIGNPLVTDDENRNMAVDFFNKALCKFLYDRL